MSRHEAVTRDQLELEIWRITGTRDAGKVDQLLGLADSYARARMEQTDRDRAWKDMLANPGEWTKYGIMLPAASREATTPGHAGDGHPPYARGGQPMRKEGHPPFSKEIHGIAAEPMDPPPVDRQRELALAEIDQMIREVKGESADDDPSALDDDDDRTQVCTKCGVDKPLADFTKDRSTVSGRRSRCRACQAVDRKGRSPRVSAES